MTPPHVNVRTSIVMKGHPMSNDGCVSWLGIGHLSFTEVQLTSSLSQSAGANTFTSGTPGRHTERLGTIGRCGICVVTSSRPASGVLPVSTVHLGDVRCDGRSHGRAPAEGRRQARVQHGVQAKAVPRALTGEKTPAELSELDISPSVIRDCSGLRKDGADDSGPGQ